MAFVNVIADYLGKISTLLSGDTISPSNLGTGASISTKYLRGDGVWSTIGASAPWVLYEIDLGDRPTKSATILITEASTTIASNIVVVPCGLPATDRGEDDFEWDGLMLAARPLDGEFKLYVTSNTYVKGKRNILYNIN